MGGPGSRGSTRPNILTELYLVDVIVEAFKSHVDRVGPKRRRKFWQSAYEMLMHDRYPLAEILDVIEHAFAHQDRLAYTMDDADDTLNGWDRGLTRLRQIRDFYPEILADMTSKPSPKDDPPAPPTDWSELHAHLDRHGEPSSAPMPDDPAKIAEQALQAKLDESEAERKRQIADRMAKAKAGYEAAYASALAEATSHQPTDNQEGSPCQ